MIIFSSETYMGNKVMSAYERSGSSGSGFSSKKRLAVFLLPPLPPPWMGCYSCRPSQGALSSPGTHLYTWVERGTKRFEFLAQEYNTTSSTRALKPDRSIRCRAHLPRGQLASHLDLQELTFFSSLGKRSEQKAHSITDQRHVVST